VSARVALVTGAGGGLGGPFVARLVADGYRVVAADREAPLAPAGVTALAADLSDPAAVAALADAAGPVDVLVNNAAFLYRAELGEMSIEAWQRMLAVNVTAPMLLIRALAPGMAARGFGRVVNVVSNQVWRPAGPGFAAYVASKGGLLGLTRALAVELGPAGITVNAIAPGLTRTARSAADFGEDFWAAVREEQSVNRTLQPDDLVHALAYLVAEEAGAVTGQALRVDGGLVGL
jgi:NAD(P)-dependent dehydrogenase (short-subunit alcohol dehydrogenase family)